MHKFLYQTPSIKLISNLNQVARLQATGIPTDPNFTCGFSCTVNNSFDINITWIDDAADVNGYQVQVSVDNGGGVSVFDLGNNVPAGCTINFDAPTSVYTLNCDDVALGITCSSTSCNVATLVSITDPDGNTINPAGETCQFNEFGNCP